MKSFVELKTFFSSPQDRTIEHLKEVYDDPSLLYESIKGVMLPHLTPEMIKGKKVLLKPNFVLENKKEGDDICLITHPHFILATLKVLLACSPESIIIGDAPIQNCRWDLMLSEDFYYSVDSLSKEYDIPIRIVDFRKVIYYPSLNRFDKSTRTEDDYLIFDVGQRSWLEPITADKNKFRVTNYNPDRMALSHSKGMHKFCVAKEVFNSDIVITMPKPKTHRMACLTNSLKILVGINGDKDYLPHHRIGSEKQGGDCYKDYNVFRSLGEIIIDSANRRRGSWLYKPLYYLSRVFWKIGRPNDEVSANAGWYGNDTVWRMVMDLNTIARYGKLDGTLADEPQRILYTLCDGIIGGQGSGPLDPDPLALGIISFSNDPYLMDEVMGHIFGLNIQKIPLLRESAIYNEKKTKEFILNGNAVDIAKVDAIKTNVQLAPGWVNYDK